MLTVFVAYSPAARHVEWIELRLDDGATAQTALAASGLVQRYAELGGPDLKLGVWGRRCSLSQRLRDGDRLELYRPLRIDPKEARRARGKRARKGSAPAVQRQRSG